MDCHQKQQDLIISEHIPKILLMGNPNVGKSVVFSKLTGMNVLTANYPGSTVSFTKAKTIYGKKEAVLIDVPGTYTLEATSPAEEVAINLLNEGANLIICVLDATNLERNLNLALQVREYNIPTIYVLNFMDISKQQGITIDVERLEGELGSPVIPMVAIRNIGFTELLKKSWGILGEEKIERNTYEKLDQDQRWVEIGRIINQVQQVEHRHPTFWETMGELTLRPFPGLPIALLVLLFSMGFVVGGGKGIRSLVFLPFINNIYTPFVTNIVNNFVEPGIFFNILVGEFGVLIKGIEWPFALILPYVFLFYIVLSFLEDSGYLPRLGVLLDAVLGRLGIQGGNIVPLIMGYGCAVPAILGTRASTSPKERIIVAGLVSLAVPCVAQTGAFIALLGDSSVLVLILVYLISFASLFLGGVLLNKFLPGKTSPILLEVPNLLRPQPFVLVKKIWIRTKQFMIEAEIPMVLAIAFAALVVETGFLNSVGYYINPLVVGWLGLPTEASLALILGLIRRELAVLPLVELDLSTLQLLVGSVVALYYLPCLSVVAVLIKEFGFKIASFISLSTVVIAFFVGGLINQIARIFI